MKTRIAIVLLALCGTVGCESSPYIPPPQPPLTDTSTRLTVVSVDKQVVDGNPVETIVYRDKALGAEIICVSYYTGSSGGSPSCWRSNN